MSVPPDPHSLLSDGASDDRLRPVVRRSVLPAPVDEPALESVQKRATVPWYKKLIYLLRGYAIEDISVLHESAIRAGVGKAEQQMALAQKTYAEAEQQRAEAEKARAEARKLQAEAELAEAEAAFRFAMAEHASRQAAKARNAASVELEHTSGQGGDKREGESAAHEAIEEAVAELQKAISVIRLKGGEVYLSETQILEALRALGEDGSER